MVSRVALILGAGSNVGKSVATALIAEGYQVAYVSRNPSAQMGGIHVAADLADSEAVERVFEVVEEKLGVPSVVIYNAGAATANEANDPLALPATTFTRDLSINTISAYVAAQQAVACFKRLAAESSRTFIFTGNVLNVSTIPTLMDLGVGKSATSHFIQCAASAYSEAGFKFYYADERKPDGSPAYFDIDGHAHGQHYVQLARHAVQGPWHQTFVKGQGYREFTRP